MKRKLSSVNENVEIIYEMENGRTSIINGKVFSKNREFFIVKLFKRVILSLNNKEKYDLVEITSSTIKILRKSIQKINPVVHNFNYATEGFDDGEY